MLKSINLSCSGAHHRPLSNMMKIELGEHRGRCRPLDYILICQETPALFNGPESFHTGTHIWTHTRTGYRSPGSRHHSQAFDCSSMCWGMLIRVTMTWGAGANSYDLKSSCRRRLSGATLTYKLFMTTRERDGKRQTQRLREKKRRYVSFGKA